MAFPYKPLGVGEIRLLRSRRSPANSFKFTYDLIHISLDSNPQYSALSYTWGPPGDAGAILLNNVSFPVRQNLHDALTHVNGNIWTKKIATTGDSYLWVDAICINQGTDEAALHEKSTQIRLMTRIYEQASHVLVWLGKADDEFNNRLAFQKMAELEKKQEKVMIKNRPYRPWWWPHTKGGPSSEHDFTKIYSDIAATERAVLSQPEAQRAWMGLCALWAKPWWTRTWIYQEATVPEQRGRMFIEGVTMLSDHSRCRFLCSDQVASWTEISLALTVGSQLQANAEFLKGSIEAPQAVLRFRRGRGKSHVRELFDILQHFRHTQCQDPRDKVYAPLCLAPADAFEAISPAYGKQNVYEAYLAIVRYSLSQRGRELDFLGHTMWWNGRSVDRALGDNGELVFPSWVPNWAEQAIFKPIAKMMYVSGKDRPSMGFIRSESKQLYENITMVRSFDATARTLCTTSIVGNELHVQGVFCDTIQDIIPYGSTPEIIAVSREKSYRWGLDSKGKYPTGEKFQEAYCRTYAMDLKYDWIGRPCGRGGAFDSALSRKKPVELTQAEIEARNKMLVGHNTVVAGRYICLTRGGYLALAPASVMVGDAIFAFFGGQVLYVVRNKDWNARQFTYIGETYVHGLMDGAVIQWVNAGRVQVQVLVLV